MSNEKRAVKQFIERHIKEGFMQRDDIVQATVSQFRSQFGGPDFCRAVTTTVDKYLARYLIMESGWPLATDCDKLDKAFAELETLGIVARQHFACCNECAHEEMQKELRLKRVPRWPIRAEAKGTENLKGFAFFHQQDTEEVIKYGTLFLTFDSLQQNGERAVEIGTLVVAVLRRAGLSAVWNGSCLQRIAVEQMQWRKRRFSTLVMRNTE